MRSKIVMVGVVSFVLLVTSTLLPQTLSSKKPSFEVASVKRNNSGAFSGGIGRQTDRFSAMNTTLSTLVQFAYRRSTDQRVQMFGLPRWSESERFDIEAKPEGDSRVITSDEMRLIVQSLLEERFQLKVHRETRQLSIYMLVVEKNGPKLKPSEESEPSTLPSPRSEETARSQSPFGAIPARGVTGPVTMPRRNLIMRMGEDLVGTGVDMTFLSNFLAQQVDRPVIDKTNLKGFFDFKLPYIVDPTAYFGANGTGAPAGLPAVPSGPSGPSIFTAVQEIGLRLESAKGPVEVLVIDRVERPSEN